jgi:uncharacterized protein
VRDNVKQNQPPKIWAAKLKDYFSKYNGAVIAYSGGVDSALLAYVAHLALGDKMLAALADSPSLARREFRHAVNFSRQYAIPLQTIQTQEMENPLYLANQGDRCYHCKKALFEKIDELRIQLGNRLGDFPWPIFYGVNLDDLGDYRPGILAAKEAAILAPYVELGMDKGTIRSVCDYYNLEIADKPAMPCMASRIRYGQRVTEGKLKQIEDAEDYLLGFGFHELRVRHHGDTARIEVPCEDFNRLLKHREKISKRLHKLGFTYVSLDLDGFKSGSLNAVLKDT